MSMMHRSVAPLEATHDASAASRPSSMSSTSRSFRVARTAEDVEASTVVGLPAVVFDFMFPPPPPPPLRIASGSSRGLERPGSMKPSSMRSDGAKKSRVQNLLLLESAAKGLTAKRAEAEASASAVLRELEGAKRLRRAAREAIEGRTKIGREVNSRTASAASPPLADETEGAGWVARPEKSIVTFSRISQQLPSIAKAKTERSNVVDALVALAAAAAVGRFVVFAGGLRFESASSSFSSCFTTVVASVFTSAFAAARTRISHTTSVTSSPSSSIIATRIRSAPTKGSTEDAEPFAPSPPFFFDLLGEVAFGDAASCCALTSSTSRWRAASGPTERATALSWLTSGGVWFSRRICWYPHVIANGFAAAAESPSG